MISSHFSLSTLLSIISRNQHVYHEECISSWTSNHVKCPLCNYDLMAADPSLSAASGGGASAVDPARPASAIDTIV